jgi:prevent-host-death family protein
MESEDVGIFEAKTHLSQLVDRVASGGVSFRITRRGKPVAELRAIEGKRRPLLKFGYGKRPGDFVSDDFDAPIEDFRGFEK